MIQPLVLFLQFGSIASFAFSRNTPVSQVVGTTLNKKTAFFTKLESQLVPEENLTVDLNRKSSSGSVYGDVLSGLSILYPDEELSTRNALSRTDGYWKYISRGEEPPQTLTYGEFDFLFFAELIDKALDMHSGEVTGNHAISEKTFLDIGSGTGRLVIGAAALHPALKLCRGLEILPGIHEKALDSLNICKDDVGNLRLPQPAGSNEKEVMPLAPIILSCGSFSDPYEYFGDSDVIFIFSTCFSEDMMSSLSDGIGRQCKPGTIIITTEYKLNESGTLAPSPEDSEIPHGDYEIELIESIDGWNWLVGGQSTAHFQRLTKSLWKGPNALQPKEEIFKKSAGTSQYNVPRQLSFEEFVKAQ